jgi:hypothetical protein
MRMKAGRSRAFSVPMIGSDGWIRVPLSALGRDSRAIVDTGAFAELCVPYADAKRWGAASGEEPKLYPNGDANDCMLRQPVRFRLGHRRFRADSVLAWERAGLRDAADPVTHILGLKFLLRYKTEFDFRGRKVVFHPLSSSPERRLRGASAIPFQLVCGHAIAIPGMIRERPGWFLWDTGAEHIHLFPAGLKLLKRSVRWSKRELSNVYGFRRSSRLPFPLRLTVSGFGPGSVQSVRLETGSAYALDAPGDRRALEESVGRRLLGLLNLDLCGAVRLIIDPQRCLVWRVSRDGAASAAAARVTSRPSA